MIFPLYELPNTKSEPKPDFEHFGQFPVLPDSPRPLDEFFDFLVLENNNTDVLKQFARKSVEKNLKNRRESRGWTMTSG